MLHCGRAVLQVYAVAALSRQTMAERILALLSSLLKRASAGTLLHGPSFTLAGPRLSGGHVLLCLALLFEAEEKTPVLVHGMAADPSLSII